jgi:hypothetical protein
MLGTVLSTCSHKYRALMTDKHDDEWCGTQEAARRLGVTPAAVRNRIRRRTIEVKPNGNIGRLVRVPRTVPSTRPAPMPSADPEPVPGTDPEPAPNAVADLISELRDRIKELQAERAAMRHEMAQERAAAAQERAAVRDALTAQVAALAAVVDELRRDRQEVERRRGFWGWFRRSA